MVGRYDTSRGIQGPPHFSRGSPWYKKSAMTALPGNQFQMTTTKCVFRIIFLWKNDVMVPCLSHHAASEISYFPLILFLSFLSHFLGWGEVGLYVSLENSYFFNKVFSFCFTQLQGHFMSGKFNGSLIPSTAELMAKLSPLSKGCLLALVPFNQSILAPCLTFLLASYVELIIEQL